MGRTIRLAGMALLAILMIILAVTAFGPPAHAQDRYGPASSTSYWTLYKDTGLTDPVTGAKIYGPITCTTSGCTSGGGGGGGTVAIDQTTPGSTNNVAIRGRTAAAGQVQPCVDTIGTFCAPMAGTSQRVVTKTNLASNTSTTICPTATVPVSTEIFFTTGGVGISLSGGTLTTATVGTTAGTTPDLSFATANTLYTLPVAATNAITAYGAAGIVVCIQTVRQ